MADSGVPARQAMTFPEKLRVLDQAATPRPWMITTYAGGLSFGGRRRAYKGTHPEYGEPWPVPRIEADHDLLVFLRNAAPELVAVLEAVDYELDWCGDQGTGLVQALDALNAKVGRGES